METVQAVGVIVPVWVVPFATSFTAQLTAVFVSPVTVALNWNCSLVPMVTPVGERLTRTPESIVTSVIANTDVFPCAMATTLTSEFGGKIAGPVYNPAVVIEPSVEFPPVTQPVGITMFGAFEMPVAIACGAASQTSQVTSVFCMPTTEALNCCVPVRTTVVCPTGWPKLDAVLIVSLTGDEEPLPHPTNAAAITNTPAMPNFIRCPSGNFRARAFRTPSLASSTTPGGSSICCSAQKVLPTVKRNVLRGSTSPVGNLCTCWSSMRFNAGTICDCKTPGGSDAICAGLKKYAPRCPAMVSFRRVALYA